MATAEHLVGRTEELQVLDRVLARLDDGHPVAIEIRGEPGIGKTRLLEELGRLAEQRGWLVLFGSASELERDLPVSVFLDALDEYLGGLDPGTFAGLGEDVRIELAHLFPSLTGLALGGTPVHHLERYRTHRAVRALLDHLARSRPLVLVLDDLHWTDAASVELLGALLHRPPVAPVLIVAAVRPHRVPERLSAALERAHRESRLIRVELGALSRDEASELLGEEFGREAAADLYEESGGNPFYLEQLARFLHHGRMNTAATDWRVSAIGVPPAVAISLGEELALLSDSACRLLKGAAVAGDPFAPELAAAAANLAEDTAMDAVDELLDLGLIRPTEVPRRFRFRHPLLRRAVYEATAAGWRLGAHERCAIALGARGASAAVRAHHLERSAREGDRGAVAVLQSAGQQALRLAPASAARWFAAALRILPDDAPACERIDLLQAGAAALTAAGRLDEGHSLLVDAIAIVPDDSPVIEARLARVCAGVESALGRYDQAHIRLVEVLESLQEPGSPEEVAVLIDLAMNAFWRARYDAMQEPAERALDAARRLRDAPLTAAALSLVALADSMTGAADRAESNRAEAANLVESLSDSELTRHLDAATRLAWAEVHLDRYVEADAHASRALALGRASGQGELVLVLVQTLGRVWYVRGKLAETAELLDGGVESARLSGNTQSVGWNLFDHSSVTLAMGDLGPALATAEEAVLTTRDLGQGFHSAWAAVRLAGALLETGHYTRAVELLLESAGGEQQTLIPGSWRAFSLELLTRCWLALDRRAEAEHAAACAEAWASTVQLPLAAAWAARAVAAVELHGGNHRPAAERALASAEAAERAQASIESALARTLAGRALAQAGETDRAIEELQHAATDLDAVGALRYRNQAERELRQLGCRIHRRSGRVKAGAPGLESLTEREFQVARLVVDRRTNLEIATALSLSRKTVETHLRNIFHKINVSSRVELARAVERSERAVNVHSVGAP